MAEKTGIVAFTGALLAWPVDVRLTILFLGAFLLLCVSAPFFPGFSFFLPIISKGRRDRAAVALTFDDGPDPVSTPLLLDLLDRHQAKATFFVTGKRARRHPHLVAEILARGHTIGNHTYSHDIFVMFKSHQTLVREIETAQQVFRGLGIVPLAFRPPVGITNPRLTRALAETGLYIVNFSRRAGDRGNRRVRHLADRILRRLRWGDIIMLHDVQPKDETLLSCWRDQIEAVLAGVDQRGIAILPLARLIERPVMSTAAAK
ncbi:MAG: polysaccharide deacetylase family protein [Desulfobacteraceae bacterium]|nr:MAG: polysaccharide deacetylase family protein [Desulfobacteraceae bacterium]